MALIGQCAHCGAPAQLRCAVCGRTFCVTCLGTEERLCPDCTRASKSPGVFAGGKHPPSRLG